MHSCAAPSSKVFDHGDWASVRCSPMTAPFDGRASTPTRALIVDLELSTPPSDGGTRAVLDLARSLDDLGYGVDLARAVDTVDSLIRSGATWEVAFLSRPSAALPLARSIRAHVSGRIIYLGHDLHFKRLQTGPTSSGDPARARLMRSMEEWCWRNTDLSLYPNADEVHDVNQVMGRDVAEYFPYFRVDDEPVLGTQRSGGAIVLGGSGHSPNVAAIEWLTSSVLPGAPPRVAAMPVTVVGRWGPAVRSRWATPSLRFVGWLPPSELRARLLSAQVMLVPLTFGAGLKSKIIDAFGTGLPVVTTPVGVQGVPDADTLAFVGSTPEEWWSHLCSILDDSSEVAAKAAAAGRYVSRSHGPGAFRQRLAQVVHTARRGE